jgi:hypothetical protein
VIPLLDEDKRHYIHQQLEQGFPEKNPLKNDNVILINPETAKNFHRDASVANMLNASHKALAELKLLIEGKIVLLMCDTVGEPEITLCSQLNIPIYNGPLDMYRKYNTREKARGLMKEAGLEVAPGKDNDIFCFV